MKIKKKLWGILYGCLLTGFTIYVLLDTFVITRVYTNISSGNSDTEYPYTADSGKNNTDNTENQNNSESIITPVITESSYHDENISITITEYRQYDTNIYVADVQLSSPEYLKTALAQNAYGKNVTEKTSEIAENNNAVFAVNGDYYGAREKGFVVRNGVLYRSSSSKNQEDLVIYENGSFSIITETDFAPEALIENGARQILSFGPALVTDGQIAVTEDEEVGKAMASNPRTAIGIIDDLHYLFVVSDGRTDESAGLTLYELAEFMQSLDAAIAYNLDGGGSSTMYFNGEIINNPTSGKGKSNERSVSDIVYIGY